MTIAPGVEFFPTRSTRHHEARAYRVLADWLAWLRLKGRADRTLDDYERTIAALIEWRDKDAGDYTLEDLEHFILLKYGAKPGARVRMSHLKGWFVFLYGRDRIPKNLLANYCEWFEFVRREIGKASPRPVRAKAPPGTP